MKFIAFLSAYHVLFAGDISPLVQIGNKNKLVPINMEADGELRKQNISISDTLDDALYPKIGVLNEYAYAKAFLEEKLTLFNILCEFISIYEKNTNKFFNDDISKIDSNKIRENPQWQKLCNDMKTHNLWQNQCGYWNKLFEILKKHAYRYHENDTENKQKKTNFESINDFINNKKKQS